MRRMVDLFAELIAIDARLSMEVIDAQLSIEISVVSIARWPADTGKR